MSSALIIILREAGFNSAEPRDYRGRWTTDRGSGAAPGGTAVANAFLNRAALAGQGAAAIHLCSQPAAGGSDPAGSAASPPAAPSRQTNAELVGPKLSPRAAAVKTKADLIRLLAETRFGGDMKKAAAALEQYLTDLAFVLKNPTLGENAGGRMPWTRMPEPGDYPKQRAFSDVITDADRAKALRVALGGLPAFLAGDSKDDPLQSRIDTMFQQWRDLGQKIANGDISKKTADASEDLTNWGRAFIDAYRRATMGESNLQQFGSWLADPENMNALIGAFGGFAGVAASGQRIGPAAPDVRAEPAERPPDPSEVPRVNDRVPINSRYAGSNYPPEKLPPEVQGKYPDGVPFKSSGFPDYSGHAKSEVRVEGLTGESKHDTALANKAAGFDRTPRGYVWHHVEDGVTMQLVPEDLHRNVGHTGGAAVIKDRSKQE